MVQGVFEIAVADEAERLLEDIERRLTVEETLTEQLLEHYGLTAA
jgi:hypothetical protein